MKWANLLLDLHGGNAPSQRMERAHVEALRAIAEELEKLNGLLERVVGGKILIGSTDDDGELESVKAAMMNIEPGTLDTTPACKRPDSVWNADLGKYELTDKPDLT